MSFLRWYQQRYSNALDPLARHALRHVGPVYPDDVWPHSEAEGFLQLVSSLGLECALTVQARGAKGSATVCTFWGDGVSCSDRLRLSGVASWLVSHLHEATLEILNVGRTHLLTDAERSCLTLLARGVRARDIAKSLGVSERTVAYYVETATHKLGARRPVEAITKALMQDEISALGLAPRPWRESDKLVVLPGLRKEPDDFPRDIRRLRMAPCLDSVAAATANVMRSAGFDRFALIVKFQEPFRQAHQYVLTNYPDRYREAADDERRVRLDPALGGGPFSACPVFWDGERRVHSDGSGVSGAPAPDEVANGFTAMARSSDSVASLSCYGHQSLGYPEISQAAFVASQVVRLAHVRIVALKRGRGPQPELTPAELECLGHLAAGMGLKGVASVLDCSTRMARYHIKKLSRKLGASTSREAVSRAVEQGMLQMPARSVGGGIHASAESFS